MDVKPAQHFIDGQFVDGQSGKTFATVNPADQRPITTVAEGLAADIDRAVRAARRAFNEGPWARGGRAADRARLLRRVGDLINKHGDQLAYLETMDTGLPIKQARGQAARAAENFYFFAEMATRMTGESF
ncbi:MAG: 5-carboxymethyl-2-hydroxymuconate semialdehyde dehydrogenase, partial [Firmicutes bacterium]|nr:5-carboxymethyl-2-hydroxymuconate semialdehyde dehydrogenase [Bacillota bacterium]